MFGFVLVIWYMTITSWLDFFSSHRAFNLELVIPLLVLLVVAIWCTCRVIPLPFLIGTRSFRKGATFNLKISNIISSEGIHSKTPDSESSLKWSCIPKVIESADGFAIYFTGNKNYFLWMPKSGFLNPNDVDRCRDLIRANVPKFSAI